MEKYLDYERSQSYNGYEEHRERKQFLSERSYQEYSDNQQKLTGDDDNHIRQNDLAGVVEIRDYQICNQIGRTCCHNKQTDKVNNEFGAVVHIISLL